MRLYGTRQLSEHGGKFWVHARCNSCARKRCFLASDLERRLPMHLRVGADLDTLKERMKCAGCGARRPTLWAMSEAMDDDAADFDFLIDFG